MAKSLRTNITINDKNHLIKYKGFQKNTNFEILVSFRDSVRILNLFLNSLIDSSSNYLDIRETFKKINDKANPMAIKTMQVSNADKKATLSSVLNRMSYILIRPHISNGENYECKKFSD